MKISSGIAIVVRKKGRFFFSISKNGRIFVHFPEILENFKNSKFLKFWSKYYLLSFIMRKIKTEPNYSCNIFAFDIFDAPRCAMRILISFAYCFVQVYCNNVWRDLKKFKTYAKNKKFVVFGKLNWICTSSLFQFDIKAFIFLWKQ